LKGREYKFADVANVIKLAEKPWLTARQITRRTYHRADSSEIMLIILILPEKNRPTGIDIEDACADAI